MRKTFHKEKIRFDDKAESTNLPEMDLVSISWSNLLIESRERVG